MPPANLAQTLQSAIQHHQAGRLAQAEAIYREVLVGYPNSADALHYLGVIAHQRGRNDVAVELIGRAATLAPGSATIHGNLGEVLRHLGRLDDAIACFRRALELEPGLAAAHNNLGNVLKTQGQLNAAATCFQQALALNPDSAEAHSNLGNIYRERNRFAEASACYQRALALKPDSGEILDNLGIALRELGRLDEALACHQRALTLKPDLANAHNNLGGLLKDRGQLDEAIASYRRAIALQPHRADIHSNLILALHYRSGHESEVIAAELRSWNRQHARPHAKSIAPHANDRSPERRLRIGYVSPDFRAHAVGWFLQPLFAAHDPQTFEIFGYSITANPDAITADLQSHCAGWREIAARTDDDVARMIRADRIDVLVDLALHTARNRLPIFARQPAPVQATYLAYPGNSGLETIGYRITDLHLDLPDRSDPAGAELPVRLPETYWCYQPNLRRVAELTPLPANHTGHLTFGCLNNFCKITPAVLEVWGRLLQAVPAARLLLHAQPGSHRDSLQQLFSRQGVDPRRLEFVGRVAEAQYFQQYQAIDIALDPFPFPGGTTTCDALWMGVPVISLAGPTPLTRGGLSILSNVGLPELAAHSIDGYIEIAARLADDLPRLAALRASLRERMQKSPLMDAPRFTRGVEAAYRAIWRTWCAPASAAPT
jgi:protein O-GlcNAc transferase